MKIEKSRLLLVEGHDEKGFCNALLAHLGIAETVQVECFQDAEIKNNNFRITLQNIVNDSDFDYLERIGIIRDSEFETNSFDSTVSDINHANTIHQVNSFPIPQNESEIIDGPPALGVLILPGFGVEGMFEDVLLEAYQDDPAMVCVDNYIQCLEEQNFRLKPNRIAKSRLRVFLVSRFISLDASKDDNWLRKVYSREWWSWDKPAFERIVQFVKHISGA